jgi:endonuclease-3
MGKERARQVLRVLREVYDIPEFVKLRNDAFETLIVTVISQNTADKNTARAFENLSKRFEITPEVLAKAQLGELEMCLKVAGLYRTKAKSIRAISKIVLEDFHGTLDSILGLPLEDARKELIKFPGVGPKTADVVLLFSAGKSTVPVDTHVNRVAKRLGFVSENGNYEDVRTSLQTLYDSSNYLALHLLLIAHGRKYCKARRPLCVSCPISTYCPSKGLWN